MGISFTFVSIACVVGAKYGYGAVLGAVLIGGIVEFFLGLAAKYWLRIVSPIVSASVVTAIGFSLLKVGVESFGGGTGAEDFGSVKNWIVASVTLLSFALFMRFAKGYLKQLSVLIGLMIRYLLALTLGMVDLSGFDGVSVFSLPKVLPVSLEFRPDAIIAFILIFLVSATETIGDTSAIAISGLGRTVKEKELSGSIVCDGIVSSLSSLIGCMPIASFSQNVGFVAMTKVVNRIAMTSGAAIMIMAGLFPVFGALIATLPSPVLGGCTLIMFANIIVSGLDMFRRCGLTKRNLTVLAFSLSFGLGFTQAPGIFDVFPDMVKTVFAENCFAIAFVIAILLDRVLPVEKDAV